MSKDSTRFGKWFKNISFRNVKGLCLLFVCLFGALALVLVPSLTANAGTAGGSGAGGSGSSGQGSDSEGNITVDTRNYVNSFEFFLISRITMSVDEIVSDALYIQSRNAIVSASVAEGDSYVEVDLDGIGSNPLQIIGLAVGEAELSVMLRVRQVSGVVEHETRVIMVTVR